ncbi:formate dehydrogenase accessory sulfurtransferase FdhD [Zoogloea sp.]|uniref:formate dehydrogenase accessory sulfurtransferase FdhD n=1 Tax=Zoogloea sp. TaxID=49181 RepID=UPI00141681FF|nr:MAG: formate dehydrogenase accessory sulfurtransferase FdhD [Zoogloea sp.]
MHCPAPSLSSLQPDIPTATRTAQVWRIDGSHIATGVDQLIEEIPVALVYNGISHAVLLATPADLEDLALGFSLSEGILASRSELYDAERVDGSRGIELRLEIASERFASLKARRRNLAGRTGCGLCGVESLDALARPQTHLPPRAPVPIEAAFAGLAALPGHQPLRQTTGAVHAAAWIGRDGVIHALREDVGRHNALDKLLGHLAATRVDPAGGFVLVSSRASYEMVQKTLALGIGNLVAVSAPTGLAVELAREAGLGLAGFARDRRMVIYAGAEHFTPPGQT